MNAASVHTIHVTVMALIPMERELFQITERWDVEAMCGFLAQPELYWQINDHLSPQPEALNWREYVSRQDVATYAATWEGNIVGYVQFLKRTSVGAEMTVAFREGFRGRIAKTLTLAAMANAFEKKMLLKLWATVPTDNRLALRAAVHIGMRKEGQLTKSIVRADGVRDLVLFGITRDEFLRGHKGNGATP